MGSLVRWIHSVRWSLGWRSGIAAAALLPGIALATTTINHSFTPATISQGDVSDYKIEIANDNTGSALTAVDLTSLLNSGGNNIVIVAPGVSANSCNGTLTAAVGTSAVVLTGGNVSIATPGVPGTCSITVKVSSTQTGNQIVGIPANTTPAPGTAGLVFTEGGVPNQHNTTAANATLLVTSLLPPTGSKSFNPTPSCVGLPTELTITLSNPNSGATMPLTSFTDTLPSGMVVAPTPSDSVACTGTGFANGTVTATAGSGSVTLAGGTIGQSGACTVKVNVVVSGAAGTYTNSLAAGAIGNTRGLTSSSFSRPLTVSAPMAVTKTFNPTTVPVGATSTMTIVVTNNGGLPFTSTAFTDVFPSANLELVSVGVASCTSGTSGTATPDTVSSPHRVVYTGGTVAASGGTCTITATVRALSESLYTNSLATGAVTNAEGIGSPAASANLQAYSQLQVNKTVSPTSVAPGQWATFSVRIRNYASGAVTNANFTDTLPVVGAFPMELDPSEPPAGCGFGFTSTGPNPVELSGTGGTIPAAEGTTPGECTVTFRARPPAGANVGATFINALPTNNAVTGVGPGGTTVVNTNTSSASLPVIDAVDLSKTFSPGSIAAGQTSLLTITVFNRTVNPLTAINLTDNLPTGLTLAADPNASTTCTGGSLQAFPGDNKVTLAGATAPARPAPPATQASCTITVRVTGATPNAVAYTNTIQPANFTSSAGTIPGDRSANLTVTAGLSAAKQFQPTRTAPGGAVRATVTVTNQSNGALTNVSINDDGLAAGLVVANPANASTSCSGTPIITANPGATGVRLDGAALSAGASCDLSFDVLAASGAGPWTNTLGVGKVTSAEGPTNSQVVTSTLNSQTASLALNKQFSPLIVTGNQPSVLTIDVVNTSAVLISNVSFTDVFPQGIQVYSSPNTSTTCTGGTVAATPGAGQVSLTGAQLAAGASCQVKVTVTSVAFLNLTNTIPAGAVSSQGGYTNATPTSATLSTLQGLGVSKGFEPAYVAPNAVSRLKIRLVNSFDPNVVSPTVLTGVSYTDQLPLGLVFAPVPNAVSTCTGAQINVNQLTQAVTLSGVTLAPGSVCDLEVNVTAAVQGAYLNSIPPGGVTTDQGVTNPTPPAEATLNVVPGPNVSKMFSTSPIKVGDRTELIVTVTNNANVPLTGVKLADNLPPELAVANPSNSSTTCVAGSVTASPGASSVALQGATVPANGSCTFRAFVVASKPGMFTNTIGSNAITSNQGLTNGNPADAPVVVLTPPGISKVFTPAQIASSGTSTLRIRLDNTNATAITLSSALVDALPGNVFVHSTPNINGNLGGAAACPGAVTATAGAINLTYADGASIPAGGCTISVDVTSSVTGNYLNTIAAGQLDTSSGKNPDPANATLGVDVPAAPSVNKAFNPTAIDQGATSTLTITLGNPNTSALTLASPMIDTLPTNVVVATPPGIGGTCTVGQIAATAGGNTVAYATGASIPPAGCTITVNVTSSVAGSYTNTILAGGLVSNEAGANPVPTNAGLVVRAPGEPTVLKAFSPSTINPGGVSKLTITLGNSNATVATLTADLVDTLPADVLVATSPVIGGTCAPMSNIEAVAGGTSVTYKTGATIPANGGCTIEVNVTSTKAGGPYVNTIAAGDLKTTLGNNGAPATAGLIVNPGQPPSVSKSFAPASIVSGQQSTLTISLGNGNAGPLTLTADMTDTLTNMTAVMPAVTTGTTCTVASVAVSAGAVTYQTGGVIPAGGCVIAVRVTSSTVVGAPGHPNTIAVGALKTDGGDNAVPTTANLIVTSSAPGAVASIAGTVYHDRNDNGAIDIGEEGIGGVTINLTQGGIIFATTTTGPDGKYNFPNLAPGNYTVVEVNPAGWIDGKDTVGVGASGGLGTAGNDVISNVTLAGGDAATEYNFGERKPPGGVASIPTLSDWGLILMSGLMGLMALWQMGVLCRRRH